MVTQQFINGQLVPNASALLWMQQHGQRYEDGVFESMLWTGERIRLLNYHTQRLQHALSLKNLQLADAFNAQTFEAWITATVKANAITTAHKVKCSVFPSTTTTDPAHVVIEVTAVPEVDLIWNEQGWKVCCYTKQLIDEAASLNLKSNQRFIYTSAWDNAHANACDDAFLFNTNQQVVESAIANVFIYSAGKWITPPLQAGEVAGVMRRFIIETVGAVEEPITMDRLLQADSVVISNAVRTIKWVVQVENKIYSVDPARQLYQQLQASFAKL